MVYSIDSSVQHDINVLEENIACDMFLLSFLCFSRQVFLALYS